MIDLQTLSLDSFAGRPVAVLGLARSGVALARFLVDRGAYVTVYDARPEADLAAEIGSLEGRSVELMLGPGIDPATALAGQALIATSPSVNSRYSTTEPRMRAALADVEAAGRAPVVSEIDLFLRLCPAVTIGVTGTKGKTTTSSLAAAVLAAGPNPAILGGNIGIPLVERLPELTPNHRVVIELSELQLPTISRGTHVSVYSHVTSDHLDRHGTVEAYRAAKRRLAELTDPNGRLVLNAEDPVSSAFSSATAAESTYYLRGEPDAREVGVRDEWIVADGIRQLNLVGGGSAVIGPGGRVMPLGEIGLRGEHNTSNVLAAVTVGLLFGIAPDAIRRAVAEFRGVEHRLEYVATVDGVRFVNDSWGTQPDAVIAALRSFEPPIVLIAGGRGKDLDMDSLASEVARRASAVVLIGEIASEFERIFAAAGASQIVREPTIADAVPRAAALARGLLNDPLVNRDHGRLATVLLSPAATSYDQFSGAGARGDAFKAAVRALAGEHAR